LAIGDWRLAIEAERNRVRPNQQSTISIRNPHSYKSAIINPRSAII